MDILKQTFKRLNIILDGIACVFLKDLVWRQIATSIWDVDKDGYITPTEASVSRGFSFNNFSTANQIEILDMRNLAAGLVQWGEVLIGVREVYYGKVEHPWTIKFINSTKLEVLDIGENIQGISIDTCHGCTKLHTLKLANKVLQEIGTHAFRDCTSLREVMIPDSTTTLGGSSFQDSGLRTVTLGSGISSIKWNAFMNCIAMESIYIKASIPPTIEATNGGIFRNCPCTIYVPIGCGAVYKTATNWSQYASRIQEYDF